MTNQLEQDAIKLRCKLFAENIARFVKSKVTLGLAKCDIDHLVSIVLGSSAQEFAFTICIKKERYDSPVFTNPFLNVIGEPEADIREWAVDFANSIIIDYCKFLNTGQRFNENKNDTRRERDKSAEWYF